MAFLLTQLKDIYVNFRGFHTDKHIVVIESDDWGSIRMPSKSTFDSLTKSGDNPGRDAFLSNDSLESEEELKDLFNVLRSVNDTNGNPAIMTANFAVANPDFDAIDIKNKKYVYEPFYNTYNSYYPNNKILDTIKLGIDEKVFLPQLHCREHLNVNRWMRDLYDSNPDTVTAFENKMIGIGTSFKESNTFGYMDAFNSHYTSIDNLREIVSDAMRIFNDTFGYASQTFVASCFVWNEDLEKVLKENGIISIQSGAWQLLPNSSCSYKRKLHFTGQKAKNGTIYTVRNCQYEPAYYQNPTEQVKSCFDDVSRAFKQGKPAIINSHRFNYIKSINRDNAPRNLDGLHKLLNMITKEFCDVEFISSAKLANLILRGSK